LQRRDRSLPDAKMQGLVGIAGYGGTTVLLADVSEGIARAAYFS